jgi:hypothetical protein
VFEWAGALRGTLQRGHLAFVEIAELAGANVLVADRADPHAPQTDDGMADRLAHPPHLAVPPLVQHDRQHRILPAR